MMFLIFALAVLASANQLSGDNSDPTHDNGQGNFCPYDRLLLATRDNVIPPGTQAVFFDANFTIAQTFGCGRLYNSSWPAKIAQDANNWLIAQFGIDWLAGTPLNNGAYNRAEGLFFPFVYGYDFMYRIQSDKVNCVETKGNNNWFIFNTGYIVRFYGSGVFPGGVMAGTTWGAGNLVSYTEYNYLNEERQDMWETTDRRWRQKVIIRSRQPAVSVINSMGLADQHVYEELVDEVGNVGFSQFSVASTNTSRWVPGGPVHQTTRNVQTWSRIQTYPSPFPSQAPCPAPAA